MYKDRADQIKSIKISKSKDKSYAERFDLNAPKGFGLATVEKFFEIEIEFKKAQQVAGIVVKQSPEPKLFSAPEFFKLSVKDVKGNWRKQPRIMYIHFINNANVDTEFRRKVYNAPWAESVKFEVGSNYRRSRSKLPMGGRFDVYLAASSE